MQRGIGYEECLVMKNASACSEALDMKIVLCHERYLRLPITTGRSKKKLFKGLADRVWKRIQGWEGKILSIGGKEVLINDVAQLVPTYTISLFQLLVGTCDEINRHLAQFWQGKLDDKGIRWSKWAKLCIPKKEGGLRYREFQSFNQALVTKVRWRLLQDNKSLIGRMLKAKYFPKCSFLEAETGRSPSNVWRAVV